MVKFGSERISANGSYDRWRSSVVTAGSEYRTVSGLISQPRQPRASLPPAATIRPPGRRKWITRGSAVGDNMMSCV